MRNVLPAAFTPPIGIRLMMTDEFLGIRAPSSVYSGGGVKKGKEKHAKTKQQKKEEEELQELTKKKKKE